MKIATFAFLLGLALGYWLRRFRKPWVCPCGWQDCDGFHCAAKPTDAKPGAPTPAALRERLDAARADVLAAVDGGRMPERRRNPGRFGR